MRCISPITVRKKVDGWSDNGETIAVPCGKCAVCLSNRRNEWIIRLSEEMKQHNIAAFVTLTYNDESIVYGSKYPTLVKEHVQLFIKNLRYRVGKIRYYAVGEYGTNTKRPHYHLIIFGLHPLNNLKDVQESWVSEKKSRGNVMCAEVNVKSISYVAKYHVNKSDYPEGSLPPFPLMSLKPPLGIGYIDSKKKFHLGNVQNAFYPEKEKRLKLPRIYKDRLYSKDEREIIAKNASKFANNTKDIEEYERKNPNSNFFKAKLDREKNFQRKYKQKSNFNNKI